MPVETVQLFYAILSLVAIGVVGAIALLRMLALVSASARRGYERTAGALTPNAIGMAWIVAMLATAGSLYFSEVAHYDPCRLCWYQRIAMYPLAIILAIAALRGDGGIRIYGRALAAIGAVIATLPPRARVDPLARHRRLRPGSVVHGRSGSAPSGSSACRSSPSPRSC